MTSFIAACGSGRSTSVIPAVPAAWSVTTIAFMRIVSSVICLFAGYVPARKSPFDIPMLGAMGSSQVTPGGSDRTLGFAPRRLNGWHRGRPARRGPVPIAADHPRSGYPRSSILGLPDWALQQNCSLLDYLSDISTSVPEWDRQFRLAR